MGNFTGQQTYHWSKFPKKLSKKKSFKTFITRRIHRCVLDDTGPSGMLSTRSIIIDGSEEGKLHGNNKHTTGAALQQRCQKEKRLTTFKTRRTHRPVFDDTGPFGMLTTRSIVLDGGEKGNSPSERSKDAYSGFLSRFCFLSRRYATVKSNPEDAHCHYAPDVNPNLHNSPGSFTEAALEPVVTSTAPK